MNYTVTANTVLEFDFKSEAEGEYHAIGFDTNLSGPGIKWFKLFGPDSGSQTVYDFDTYNLGDGWVRFVIPIGSYFTGSAPYLVFASDDLHL